jgi:O-methyltransferase involved in polyketide biosynthesis
MTDLDDVDSVRTEGDSWEITESVGATALTVAAARAVATGATDPLIRDPFAYLLVSSAGPAWACLASPDLEWIGDDEQWRRAHQVVCDYQAVRT